MAIFFPLCWFWPSFIFCHNGKWQRESLLFSFSVFTESMRQAIIFTSWSWSQISKSWTTRKEFAIIKLFIGNMQCSSSFLTWFFLCNCYRKEVILFQTHSSDEYSLTPLYEYLILIKIKIAQPVFNFLLVCRYDISIVCMTSYLTFCKTQHQSICFPWLSLNSILMVLVHLDVHRIVSFHYFMVLAL